MLKLKKSKIYIGSIIFLIKSEKKIYIFSQLLECYSYVFTDADVNLLLLLSANKSVVLYEKDVMYQMYS